MKDDTIYTKLKSIHNKVQGYIASNLSSVSGIRHEETQRLKEVREKLEYIQKNIYETIEASDKTEQAYKSARQRLVDATRDEDEKSQQQAYDRAEQLMKMQATLEERERSLRQQREYLMKEEREIIQSLARSDEMANKFRLALELLEDQAVNAMLGADSEKSFKILAAAFSLAERDSRALARDLHDGPAQKLSGAIMLYDLAERYIETGKNHEAIEELRKVKKQMQEAMADIRTFLFQIYPQGLEEGLDVALQRYAKQASDRYGVEISFQASGDIVSIPMALRSNLFRVIHQAMDNAIQKGDAKNVKIALSAGTDAFSAKISDDGKGFDVEEAKADARERGSYGLMNMEERTRLFGGNISIDSSPGRGTTVSMRVPIPEDDY
ncbi:MAG: ATP-binding protein [Aminobacterium sp.]|jgi:two-component system sensor histidine kinase DegS|uniref:sensor histidine kinase n=1 Tax=Aminobacterium sp. MB27-C1 TaxID=3070661 RepID=UPI001BCD6BB1|nr:sensor histidine kinase [Aminobacterium sp. MB27-C1]MDD3427132.1 histidine kinase [Aminobacterium sp.]MDD4552422.1 histidine kinase [Aminobacterium sp.]WMI72320.1 histidine kinase [Aminobacterium sp. MB27-C1]